MRLFKAFLPGLGVALALFAFAYALGLVRLKEEAATPFEQPAHDAVPSSSEINRELELKLDQARNRIELLEWELAQSAKNNAPEPAAAPPASDREVAGSTTSELPETLKAAGRVVGVSEEALEVAYRLEMSVRNHKPAPGALDEFVALGADGFRAVVALMRSGLRATWQKDWLEQTWEPGLEQVLIDYVEDPAHQADSAIALSCLSIADNQRVRDYLVEKVRKDPKPYTVYSAAQSLGELKEPRGAAAIGMTFAQPGWEGVRGDILHNLGRMGGVEARRTLIEYLRLEKADKLGPAITALNQIDPAAAKLEAARILTRRESEFLHHLDRNELKKIAEQE